MSESCSDSSNDKARNSMIKLNEMEIECNELVTDIPKQLKKM